MSTQAPSLRVDGLVERPTTLGFADFEGFPEADQVRDVSRFHASRRGDAVTLESVLRRVAPAPTANYVTLHAARDDFHVSVPLDAVRAEGLIVYKVGEGPLDVSQGGPIRFLIKDPDLCHTSELDDCANVKYLDRIEFAERKGRDTRPQDEAAHEALHAKEAHSD